MNRDLKTLLHKPVPILFASFVGAMIETIHCSCNSRPDCQDWVEKLQVGQLHTVIWSRSSTYAIK